MKPKKRTLREATDDLADTLFHCLQSHPIADRVPQELNVAEAILYFAPVLHRIAQALERLSPPPAPDPPEAMAAAGRTFRRAA